MKYNWDDLLGMDHYRRKEHFSAEIDRSIIAVGIQQKSVYKTKLFF